MAGSKKPRTNWKVGGNIIPHYVLHAITWYPPLSSYSISFVKMANWIMKKRLHSISKLFIFGEFYTWIWKSRLTYFKVHFPYKFASHIVSPSSWITSGPRWQMVCNVSTTSSEHSPVCERAWWEFCWVGQMKTDRLRKHWRSVLISTSLFGKKSPISARILLMVSEKMISPGKFNF